MSPYPTPSPFCYSHPSEGRPHSLNAWKRLFDIINLVLTNIFVLQITLTRTMFLLSSDRWKYLHFAARRSFTWRNEKFYKISFLSQILAKVIFCFPLLSMKGTASNICKTSVFIERYKSQTSYRTCIKYVLEKSAFSTLLIFYFISCEVGRRTQPSSIRLHSQPS